MRNISILLKVELLEAVRNIKFIWLTLFFTLLGVTQPLIDKYMEVIIKSFGGVEGIMIDPNAPEPQANEVLLATFSGQFNQIGLIVLIISFMGMIANEKNSGVQGFIFTRPVSSLEYISSKLFGNWLISMVCIAIGSFISYFYTVYLFGYYPIVDFFLFLVCYSVWILFVVSTAVLFSTLIKSSMFIGVATILLSIIFLLAGNINSTLSLFLPSGVLTLAESLLLQTHDINFLFMIAPIVYILINVYGAKAFINQV
ncbi:ABC transporter permease [Gracilibacillus alcaliphilus]|uniref:ABC transporter permease n=1 Tax=Gracilibacillus alcaliphilus TaxID=1401441 RepID=UPI00195C1F27|nr:ABC transporter permease [Gracilibacillus alcaliphilus]MBM7677448.1 ABC-2 type transport system permease protein [Gracilibacillus alcaliphilus]